MPSRNPSHRNSSRRSAAWLLLLIGPVWAFGLYHSLQERKKQTKPRSHAWYERYAKLEPYLEGLSAAAIVYEKGKSRTGNRRLFRAQYVLAPIVIHLRAKPPKPKHRRLTLIYDFEDQETLDKVLVDTAKHARRRGVTMTSIPVAKRLAVVTMKKE